MSEKNRNTEEFDLMMRSILEEAREEVPAHVWEGVSAGLDKAAQRKTVVLWWRRAAVGVAAAAAVVAGVFIPRGVSDGLVPAAGENMIAVITPAASFEAGETLEPAARIFLAQAVPAEAEEESMVAGTPADIQEAPAETVGAEPVQEAVPENIRTAEEQPAAEYFPEDWGEEKVSGKRNVSLVLSGLAGTNNALSQNRISPMMRPTMTPAPKKTGIEETSVKSSYGIPLSFGAGVKIGLGRRWSIGTGLNYTFLTRQFYGKYTKVAPEGTIESITSSDIINRQHYLGIPVNVFYDVISNDRISFYAYAGGAVEKCVLDSYNLMETSISHKDKVAGVQLSANAGIGVEFLLGKHLGLYIDPSVRYYFDCDQPKSIRTVQPLMVGFEMGLRARL